MPRRVRDVRRLRAARPAPTPTGARPATASARSARSGGRCSARSSPRVRARRAAALGTIIPSSVRDVSRRGPRHGRTVRSTSTSPRASTTVSGCGSPGRGPAAPRGGPAGDLYVAVRVAPHADARTARRRALAPAADLDRAGRARHAARASTTLDGPREIDVAVGHAARRAASGCAGSACRRCAPAAAATSCRGRRRRADAPQRPKQAELLAQFARAARREGELRRTRACSRASGPRSSP